MANTKKPLEAAFKTFVFFLVSQPLSYLFQVPFSNLGWGLFRYYPHWFFLTLLTFPAAFVGWYIQKKNRLSALILSPVLVYLGYVVFTSARECVHHFPHLLLAGLFCLLQIVLYVLAFFPKKWGKEAGFLVPPVTVVLLLITTPRISAAISDNLPACPALSSGATVSVEDESVARVTILDAGTARVYVEGWNYGITAMTVTDGETVYRYTVVVADDGGTGESRIDPYE